MAFESVDPGQCIFNPTMLKALIELAADDTGAAGPLDGSLARLVTNAEPLDSSADLGDFTQGALLGASTVALTYTGAFNLLGEKVGIKTQIEAIAGAGPTEEEITGALIVNAAADDWLAYWSFGAVDIASEGDGVSVDAILPFELEPTFEPTS